MTIPSDPERIPDLKNNTQAYDEEDFKKRLTDEYKLLQDKIDKIGAFRFTIKGWSVTAVVAASAAGAATKSLSAVATISCGLLAMLVFFYVLEYEQVRLSRLFGDRAGRVEDVFRRIDRGRGKEWKARFPVPYTAHEIVLAGHTLAASDSTERWWNNWRVHRQAHIYFYAVLMLLALGPLVPHRHEIRNHWTQIGSRFFSQHQPTSGTSAPSPKPKP